jgi:hypothetical protein
VIVFASRPAGHDIDASERHVSLKVKAAIAAISVFGQMSQSNKIKPL